MSTRLHWTVTVLATVCICLVCLGGGRPAYGQNALVEAALHFKVLGYDSNLVKDDKALITFGVLARKGERAKGGSSTNVQKDMTSAFLMLSQQAQVQRKRVRIVIIPTEMSSLHGDLNNVQIDALYVPAEFQKEISEISKIAVRRKIPTLCSSVSQAERGLAVAVDTAGAKPQVVVNLQIARQSGMALSGRLLRLVRVL